MLHPREGIEKNRAANVIGPAPRLLDEVDCLARRSCWRDAIKAVAGTSTVARSGGCPDQGGEEERAPIGAATSCPAGCAWRGSPQGGFEVGLGRYGRQSSRPARKTLPLVATAAALTQVESTEKSDAGELAAP